VQFLHYRSCLLEALSKLISAPPGGRQGGGAEKYLKGNLEYTENFLKVYPMLGEDGGATDQADESLKQELKKLCGQQKKIKESKSKQEKVVKEATPNPFAVTPAFLSKKSLQGVALAEDVLCEHIREFKKTPKGEEAVERC